MREDGAREILFLANGNLNGRVIRLVADHVQRSAGLRATLLTFGSLTTWPEERVSPHRVEPALVARSEAERRIASARVFVYAVSRYDDNAALVRAARRAGTPSVCVMADVGYGAEKLDPTDPSRLPDRVCVADPVTKLLFLRRGIPPALLLECGSPYLDTALHHAPPVGPESSEERIGLLVNPEIVPGAPIRGGDRPEWDVVRGVHEAIPPRARVTLRMHPRLAVEVLRDLPQATLESQPGAPFREFVAHHHRIIGSHSTGLLVARMLGRPALSFQPRPRPVLRQELFDAWGIPVVRDLVEVQSWLAEPLERLEKRTGSLAIEAHLYRPGCSLEAITEVIRDLGNWSARPSSPQLDGLGPLSLSAEDDPNRGPTRHPR